MARDMASGSSSPVRDSPSPNRTIRENDSTTRKERPKGDAISSRQLLVPRSMAA